MAERIKSIFRIPLIQIPDTLVGKLWTKWLKMEAWGTSTLKGCHRAGERTLMKKKWSKEEPWNKVSPNSGDFKKEGNCTR